MRNGAWASNLKAGGIPLNATVYEDPLADERQNRWMKPLAAALPHAINPYAFPEATEVVAVLELGLNRAIAGEITAVDALNSMSDDIYKIMEKYKYKTAELPKLTA